MPFRSKTEPDIIPVVEKDLPPLKKVDESWLTPTTTIPTNTTTTTTIAATNFDDIHLNLNNLSLNDDNNVPEE